ncbi:MAG: penicillin-binding protein 2 [Campylobacterota bacterium]|nr:penicillin-binding protein 2 [Campylobacterota bacterium]
MRVKFVLVVFSLVWLALLVRIFYLSVESNAYYDALSNKNTIKRDLITPVRGNIFDRNGDPIAINKLGFKIVLKPHLSSKKNRETLENELRLLTQKFPHLNFEKMLKRYKKKDSYYNHQFIPVVDFIAYEEFLPLFSMFNLRENMQILPASKRFYPHGKTAAHVIGYMSRASRKDVKRDPLLKLIGYVGKSGIEKQYNAYLQGNPGERRIKVSAFNEEIEEISHTAPDENHDMSLHLDMRLQKYIATLFKAKAGSVVVMGIDGEILAMGSYPEYDLNTFAMGISNSEWQKLINDVDAPFTNKTTNGLYPPGSVIKTGLGLIYISTKLHAWSQFNCTGSMELGKRNFRCWKNRGHGTTNINKAIRESCDDYFYKGSLKVGIKEMSTGLHRYGLGQKTGIDIPNEFIGTVPSRTWKRKRYNQPWYKGETLNTSIGQGSFLVTPLQITQFTALMASGKLPKPQVAHQVGEEEIALVQKDILKPNEKKLLHHIQYAMKEVCNHPKGTATNYINSRVKIAGKTGTAQVIGISQETKKRLKEHEMAYYQRSHAWLSTYAPIKNPKYVVTVLVEHGGHGGQAAGGIVSRIYDKLLEYGYLTKK